MQKIKEKLHIGRNKHHGGEYADEAEGYNNTYNTVGATGTGATDTGLAGTDAGLAGTGTGMTGMGAAGTGAGMGAAAGGYSESGGYRESGGYSREGGAVEERPVGVGVAEVPVVVTEQERLGGRERESLGERVEEHHLHHEGARERLAEEVCGTKTFTEVEDRPVVIERVERILEHRPVEKQYVVETRFVGENAVPSATGATVIDTNERVVEAAEPGPACPAGTGAVMDNVIGGMGGAEGGMHGGHHMHGDVDRRL